MKEHNPLEDALNQVGNILKLLQDPTLKFQKTIPPEVIKELDKLKENIDDFSDVNLQVLEEAGIDVESFTRENTGPNAPSSTLSPKDKQLLERAGQIQSEAKTLQLQMISALKRMAKNQTVDKNKQMKQRRKKFKPLGGNKGWLPM